MDLGKLKERARLAATWLAEISQKRETETTVELGAERYHYTNWAGAARMFYHVAEGKWEWGGICWHTGQTAKALVLAHKLTGDASFLQAAGRAADFILDKQLHAPDPDAGLIVAEEDTVPGHPYVVGISTQLECLAGLLAYSEAAGDERPRQAAMDDLDWVERKGYMGDGLFLYHYDMDARERVSAQETGLLPEGIAGRPLIDDAMFLRGYEITGRESWRRIFFETADRLLSDPATPVSWFKYGRSSREFRYVHPRNPYWWGAPHIDAYEASGERRYLDFAVRIGDYYERAARADGGLIRRTYEDFSTDSFGHATSGAACAVILWMRLWQLLHDGKYVPLMARSLNYCMDVQFTAPSDPSLMGAVLEKVLPPDGTDRNPYQIRDQGTFFFVQAAAQCLLDKEVAEAVASA